LDGIGGFTFGNLLTINSLPNAYKDWYFQITKVEHKISNADWTTNLSCGMMRKI
jgi:phage protein D